MAQINDEKISGTSLNGHDAHHSPNANHRPKVEFHGGGRGGRGDRYLPYGDHWARESKSRMEVVFNVWYTGRAVRYLMDVISRDNDVTREEFLNDYYRGNKPQEDNDIMHRSIRNHSETGRGGGVGENGGLFRCGLCGPPNKGDDFHVIKKTALLNDRLKQIMDPNYEIPKNDTTERKFLGQCRLYIGNLVDCTEEELIEMFKPYGEVSDIFFVRELMIGFIKLDYRTNAEKAKRELDGQTRKGHMLKIRFAPICDAAIIVDNLAPCVSNELLKYVFSVFGDIERCWLMVDKKR